MIGRREEGLDGLCQEAEAGRSGKLSDSGAEPFVQMARHVVSDHFAVEHVEGISGATLP